MPPKPKAEVLADYQRLKNTLAISGTQKWNTALYEILVKLIDLVSQSQDVVDTGGIIKDNPSGLLGDGTEKKPLSVSVDGVTITINAEDKLEASTIPVDVIDRTLWNPITKCRKFGYAQDTIGGTQHPIASGLIGTINSSGVFAGLNDVTPGVGGVCSNWTRATYTTNNANLGGIYFAPSSGPFWETKPLMAVRFRTGAILNGNDATGTPVHNTTRVYLWGLANTLPTNGTAVIGYPHVFVLCNAPDKTNVGAAGVLEFSRLVSGVQTKTAFNITLLANTHYVITVQAMSNTSSKAVIEDKTHGTIESLTVNHDNYSSTSIAGTTVDTFGAFSIASNATSVASTSTFDFNSLY